MELQKAINLIIQCAEDNGWTVRVSNEQSDLIGFEFNRFTPAGQDFYVTAFLNNHEPVTLVDSVFDYWDSFDPDYEASFWIGEDGHGQNEAPYHIKDIVEDMEAAEGMIEELYNALGQINFEED